MRRFTLALLTVVVLGISASLAADTDAPPAVHAGEENIQVTATRIPEDSENLSTVVTVLDGAMLRDRGFTDLRSALGVVAGVDIAPGGDGGPAAAVPEMWGLREFDAFLLVVDDVPWGGAFNPDLPTLSLKDVARIEVMRGSAPVMYGATSFVGVIHVIHNTAGGGNGQAQAIVGDHRSYGVSAAVDVSDAEGWSSRIAADVMQTGYPDERTDWQRGHILWRNLFATGGGKLRFDVDLHWLNQSPSSPTPRLGDSLAPIDPDANVNPLGSHMDPRRQMFTAGYAHEAGFGSWSLTASYAHQSQDILRGFLAEDPTFPLTAAHGFRQTIAQDELYADGHVNITSVSKFEFVAGADLLYGEGRAHGGDFDYVVSPDGTNPPDGDAIPSAADISIGEKRTFGGIYGYGAWTPNWRWRVDAGVRVNFTDEHRDTSTLEFGNPPADIGSDSRSETKVSGSVGAAFTMWNKGTDFAKLFGGYRNTYKPAAIDFGLDAAPDILEPETGVSYELGVRSALFDHRLDIELEAFLMNLQGIVVAGEEGGLPGLENGGDERLQGLELEVRGRMVESLFGRFAWSYHDAKYLDFVKDLGAGPVQLEGNRIEMSARDMGALGVMWAPKSGVTAHVEVRYTGSRFLDEGNTLLADAFTSWSAGVGWRSAHGFEVRVDGENLSDSRAPVSASELGADQYYRLPARQLWVSCNWSF
jgi:outer membrane receptor protein involved in Fe transport